MFKQLALCVGFVVAFLSSTSALLAEEPALKPDGGSKEVAAVMLSAAQWSSADINAVARFVDAPEFVYIPSDQGPVMYESGNPLLQLGADYGKVLQVGETARSGVFWNFGKDRALLRLRNGIGIIELRPRSLIVLGDALIEEERGRPLPGAAVGGEGEETIIVQVTKSVKCGAGYYACCKYNGGGNQMTATCIRDNAPNAPICDAGGPGATECSVSDN